MTYTNGFLAINNKGERYVQRQTSQRRRRIVSNT